MRIFLIGMPGSGKSYWMQQLAASLHYDQIDMDRYIEKREGRSIPELFTAGEDTFREKEKAALEAVLEQYPTRTIIATGGGAPCYKDNLKVMKEAGCVIYLESEIEVLIANVAQQGIDRPLLANGSRKELAEKLSELYRKRKEMYEKAHLKITADKASLSTFAQAIEQYLSDNNLSL